MRKRINLSAILSICLVILTSIAFTSCEPYGIVPEEKKLKDNESSAIIGETMVRLGHTSTYMVDDKGAKDFDWYFVSSAAEAESASSDESFTIKGIKVGNFDLHVSYIAGNKVKSQDKYIKVIVVE